MLLQDVNGAIKMIAPLLRARIVESHDKIALSRCPNSPLDDLPGCKKIGEGDAAEIMTDQSAGARRCCLEGGDTWYDLDRNAFRLAVKNLVDEGRHGIDAWI